LDQISPPSLLATSDGQRIFIYIHGQYPEEYIYIYTSVLQMNCCYTIG